MNIMTINTSEMHGTLNFEYYKRNPIEFIELEERLNRIKQTRWNVIKRILMFQEHDRQLVDCCST